MGPLKNELGETVLDSSGAAEILSRAFMKVFTKEDGANIPEPPDMGPNSFLYNINFSKRLLRKKIRELKKESAAGPDEIGPQILQELQEGLVPALTAVF